MKTALLFCAAALPLAANYQPKTLALGAQAPDFTLPATDGKDYSLADFSGKKALAVIFTTNHCPDAIASHGRMVALVDHFEGKGVAVVAINSNSPAGLHPPELGWTAYDDSFADMKRIAADEKFNLPYLYDGETQGTAKAYGAVATPHAFVFDGNLELVYEGRIDNGRRRLGPVEKNETRDAIQAVLDGKKPAVQKTRPAGCSTKWKEKAGMVAQEDAKWKKLPVALATASADEVVDLVKNERAKTMRLFNVWATTCGPCVQEFPMLADIHRQYSWQPFEVVTVSLDDPSDEGAVKIFLTEQQMGTPPRLVKHLEEENRTANNLLFKGDTEELAKAFPGWNGSMPYTLFLSEKGEKLYEHHGIIDAEELKKVIAKQVWTMRGE